MEAASIAVPDGCGLLRIVARKGATEIRPISGGGGKDLLAKVLWAHPELVRVRGGARHEKQIYRREHNAVPEGVGAEAVPRTSRREGEMKDEYRAFGSLAAPSCWWCRYKSKSSTRGDRFMCMHPRRLHRKLVSDCEICPSFRSDFHPQIWKFVGKIKKSKVRDER